MRSTVDRALTSTRFNPRVRRGGLMCRSRSCSVAVHAQRGRSHHGIRATRSTLGNTSSAEFRPARFPEVSRRPDRSPRPRRGGYLFAIPPGAHATARLLPCRHNRHDRRYRRRVRSALALSRWHRCTHHRVQDQSAQPGQGRAAGGTGPCDQTRPDIDRVQGRRLRDPGWRRDARRHHPLVDDQYRGIAGLSIRSKCRAFRAAGKESLVCPCRRSLPPPTPGGNMRPPVQDGATGPIRPPGRRS